MPECLVPLSIINYHYTLQEKEPTKVQRKAGSRESTPPRYSIHYLIGTSVSYAVLKLHASLI